MDTMDTIGTILRQYGAAIALVSGLHSVVSVTGGGSAWWGRIAGFSCLFSAVSSSMASSSSEIKRVNYL